MNKLSHGESDDALERTKELLKDRAERKINKAGEAFYKAGGGNLKNEFQDLAAMAEIAEGKEKAYFDILEHASTEMVQEAYNNPESPAEKKRAAERVLQERGLL